MCNDSPIQNTITHTHNAMDNPPNLVPQWGHDGIDCSVSGEELLCFVSDGIVVDIECVEKLGLVTVRSSHIPETCAGRACTFFSMTCCHEVRFSTSAVWAALVSVTCR